MLFNEQQFCKSGCISSLTDGCVNGTSILLPSFGNNLTILPRTADTCFIKIEADRLLECLLYMQLVPNISKVHLLFLVSGRNHCLELKKKKKILSKRLKCVWLHCVFGFILPSLMVEQRGTFPFWAGKQTGSRAP